MEMMILIQEKLKLKYRFNQIANLKKQKQCRCRNEQQICTVSTTCRRNNQDTNIPMTKSVLIFNYW